jgi:hypothetical protein
VRKVQINIMRILTTQGLLNIYFNEMNSWKYENESVDREKWTSIKYFSQQLLTTNICISSLNGPAMLRMCITKRPVMLTTLNGRR